MSLRSLIPLLASLILVTLAVAPAAASDLGPGCDAARVSVAHHAGWEWALARTKDDGATWEKFDVPGPQAYPGCGGGTTASPDLCWARE
jgi:hypothetical protein